MTKAEQVFFSRVADAMIEAGLSVDAPGAIEKGCKMVLERDEQLWLMAIKYDDQGRTIRSELCEQVYTACRQ
jgi:hypothetical protein